MLVLFLSFVTHVHVTFRVYFEQSEVLSHATLQLAVRDPQALQTLPQPGLEGVIPLYYQCSETFVCSAGEFAVLHRVHATSQSGL